MRPFSLARRASALSDPPTLNFHPLKHAQVVSRTSYYAPTPLREALAATVEWYAAALAAPRTPAA